MSYLDVLTQGPPPRRNKFTCLNSTPRNIFGGRKSKFYSGLSERAQGGEPNFLKVTDEANCSIQLTPKLQAIFITYVTSMWIPRLPSCGKSAKNSACVLLLRHC
jgi:hypothetical protein